MQAIHRPIKDFTWHIWEEHVYQGALPIEAVELAEFHAHLHASGLGHKDDDERPMRAVKGSWEPMA